MKQNPELSARWYYTIEIKKGFFTKGLNHENLAITRKLLRNVSVQGKTCIDIGTQEAIIPVLLKKNGAKKVVAYDRLDLAEKIKTVSQAYQVEFEYVGGFQLQDLPQKLVDSHTDRFFDLVVFSGVLYHMINPFGLLALARSLCKVGGLFLIETAAIQNPKEILRFNAKGAVYGLSSNYFIPSTAWLEYALRMLGLLPLQAIYLGETSNEEPFRLALLCRSCATPLPRDKDDKWMFLDFHNQIFEAEAKFNWKMLASDQSEIAYEPYDNSVLKLDNTSSLFAQLEHHPRYVPAAEEIVLTFTSKM